MLLLESLVEGRVTAKNWPLTDGELRPFQEELVWMSFVVEALGCDAVFMVFHNKNPQNAKEESSSKGL